MPNPPPRSIWDRSMPARARRSVSARGRPRGGGDPRRGVDERRGARHLGTDVAADARQLEVLVTCGFPVQPFGVAIGNAELAVLPARRAVRMGLPRDIGS